MWRKRQKVDSHPSARFRGVFKDYLKAIGLAVFLAMIIRTSVVMAYVIPSGSMQETLAIGDRIMVSKFAYDIRLPLTNLVLMPVGNIESGDIIVFYQRQVSEVYVKRVIGLPGDKIEIRDKRVFRNDRLLEEPYAQHSDQRILPRVDAPRDNFGPLTVPPGKLFVMGDNRDFSYDSRFWGFVDRSDVKGKAFLRLWSWDSDRHLPRWSRFFTSLD